MSHVTHAPYTNTKHEMGWTGEVDANDLSRKNASVTNAVHDGSVPFRFANGQHQACVSNHEG